MYLLYAALDGYILWNLDFHLFNFTFSSQGNNQLRLTFVYYCFVVVLICQINYFESFIRLKLFCGFT